METLRMEPYSAAYLFFWSEGVDAPALPLHAVEPSWLKADGMARLVAGAFWARRVGDGAMLVSFD